MIKKRTPISPDLSAQILFASDRTCCVCNIRGKRVQIHHIDEDPSNNTFQNLSVLCFDCHDETQIRGGFGKHLTAPVVNKYRDDWLVRVKQRREKADSFAISKVIGESVTEGLPMRAPLPIMTSTHIWTHFQQFVMSFCPGPSQTGTLGLLL